MENDKGQISQFLSKIKKHDEKSFNNSLFKLQNIKKDPYLDLKESEIEHTILLEDPLKFPCTNIKKFQNSKKQQNMKISTNCKKLPIGKSKVKNENEDNLSNFPNESIEYDKLNWTESCLYCVSNEENVKTKKPTFESSNTDVLSEVHLHQNLCPSDHLLISLTNDSPAFSKEKNEIWLTSNDADDKCDGKINGSDLKDINFTFMSYDKEHTSSDQMMYTSTPFVNLTRKQEIKWMNKCFPINLYIEASNQFGDTTENTEQDSINRNITEISIETLVPNQKESVQNFEFWLNLDNLNLVKNEINFICPICISEIESGNGIVLHECLHMFCIECLRKTVEYAEEALIKCPFRDEEYSCQCYLQQREIKALVADDVYEKYLQKSIITAESIAEKSFHCKTPDCKGWCMFEDGINIFHCPVCSHYNCLNCNAIHEGFNCRQYQDKLRIQNKMDKDSEKTLAFLNKMIQDGKAMKCPKCDLILMKRWGCDWLKCSICKTEVCWVTKGPRWGPAGQGDISSGCRCGVNGVKCHPSCSYCH